MYIGIYRHLGDLSQPLGHYVKCMPVYIIDVQDYFTSQQRGNYKFIAVVRQNIVPLNGIRQQYGRIMLCGCLILLKCKY